MMRTPNGAELHGLRITQIEHGSIVSAVLHRKLDAPHYVVHVREVAPHVASVKQCNGLDVLDLIREERDGHVRPAPRAIHGKKSKPDAFQAVEVVVRRRDLFAREF